MPRQRSILQNIDSSLLLMYLVFVVAGWMSIFSTSYTLENYSFWASEASKQMIFISISFIIGIVILLFDKSFFEVFAIFFYVAAILLLLAVLIFGTKISGARSWFQFGTFSFQPAEFAKVATCLALAKYMSSSTTRSMNKFGHLLVALLILVVPVGLILLQPDMGSALIFISFLFVLYREGMSAWYIWILTAAVVIFVFTLLFGVIPTIVIISITCTIIIIANKKTLKNITIGIVFLGAASGLSYFADSSFEKLEKHQKDRINILLGKEYDTRGIGYNLNQSKIAIGSGGIIGKGYMQGTQNRLNFVPEQKTDFIFCTVGEEWGFVGSAALLILFFFFIRRIMKLAEQQHDRFAKVYGYGIAGFFFFHVFINVGMVSGLLPVIGIPLPFFSYGGSSLICFTMMLFIFLKQNATNIKY